MIRIREFFRRKEEESVKKKNEDFKKNFDPDIYVKGMSRTLHEVFREHKKFSFVTTVTWEQRLVLMRNLDLINEIGAKQKKPIELVLNGPGLDDYVAGMFYHYKVCEIRYKYI